MAQLNADLRLKHASDVKGSRAQNELLLAHEHQTWRLRLFLEYKAV